MLYLDPDWDSKTEALDLRNHYEPILINNEKVICQCCGKRHFPDEETFIIIYGNITVGFGGGIIGNNFSKDGKLKRAACFCRKESCFKSIVSLLEKTTLTRTENYRKALNIKD